MHKETIKNVQKKSVGKNKIKNKSIEKDVMKRISLIFEASLMFLLFHISVNFASPLLSEKSRVDSLVWISHQCDVSHVVDTPYEIVQA